MKKSNVFILALAMFLWGCPKDAVDPKTQLQTDIQKLFAEVKGEYALAFVNLHQAKDSLFINADSKFHAASTMKVPVMIGLYQMQADGQLDLASNIAVRNSFKSIVDGSSYTMDVTEDSEGDLYKMIGDSISISALIHPMITRSSNLATNILIELADAKKVTAQMRQLGAKNIEVLRGVEDQKAYDQGLSNSTTARDLLVILKALAEGKAVNQNASDAMINILMDQQFRDVIPKYLPEEVPIANKTGSITALHHDAGIVYHPTHPYVLVLLSKNLEDFDAGTEILAKVSKRIYAYMEAK